MALAEPEYTHPRPARQEHQEAQQAEQVRAGAALHEAVLPAAQYRLVVRRVACV